MLFDLAQIAKDPVVAKIYNRLSAAEGVNMLCSNSTINGSIEYWRSQFAFHSSSTLKLISQQVCYSNECVAATEKGEDKAIFCIGCVRQKLKFHYKKIDVNILTTEDIENIRNHPANLTCDILSVQCYSPFTREIESRSIDAAVGIFHPKKLSLQCIPLVKSTSLSLPVVRLALVIFEAKEVFRALCTMPNCPYVLVDGGGAPSHVEVIRFILYKWLDNMFLPNHIWVRFYLYSTELDAFECPTDVTTEFLRSNLFDLFRDIEHTEIAEPFSFEEKISRPIYRLKIKSESGREAILFFSPLASKTIMERIVLQLDFISCFDAEETYDPSLFNF